MKKNEKPDLIDHILGWIFTNPFKALYFVALIAGFVIRMDLSLRNKGILHPDELYQSLEIAHHMVYGSGYIPPEFRSEFDPPSYASSRSWLFPLIFASIMRFGEFFGLDYHDGSLFLIRVMLGINATLIIPATKKLTFQLTKNEICAFISAVYIAFWFRMIEYGVRSFTNTFFLPYLFFGIAFTLKMLEEKNFSIKNSIIFAITVPLTVYIRLDLGIIIFSFFLVTFKRENLNSYMKLGLIGVVTWLLAGYYDYTMYEGAKFMSVPINWYTFNVIEGYSKNFGVSSPLYYVGVLIGLDRLWPWLLLIIFTTIFYKGNELDLENKNFNELFDGYYITLKSSIIIWIIYSNFWSGDSHKEIRFMIGGLGIFLILISMSITINFYYFEKLMREKETEHFKIDLFILSLSKKNLRVIIIFLLIFSLPINSYYTSKTMMSDISYDDINEALAYVGKQDPLTSVIIIEHWSLTGQYTYLHRSNDIQFIFIPLRVDEDSREINKIQLHYIIKTGEIGEFIIFPRYQQYGQLDTIQLLVDYHWIIETVVDGRSDVWKYVG